MKLVTDNGLGYWERSDGSQQLATKLSQYFHALKSQSARDELKRIGLWYSNTLVEQACGRAWAMPGLSAMQTVAEVQRDLEERFYLMNAEPVEVVSAGG